MAAENYVVLKSIHPTWCTTQLPGEVAELLGSSAEDLKGLHRPARSLAFLARGQGTLRVLSLFRSSDLLQREMRENRVVATAQLTDKLVFNIPAAVEEYLGLVSFPRETPSTRGTDDMIVWFIPEEEYYEYRDLTRDKSPFSALSSGQTPRVYLTKSIFSALRPSLSEEEGLKVRPARSSGTSGRKASSASARGG